MINIMIVGVGGQGSLLASRFIGQVFLNEGLEVKVSEVHGMSQRGGSVVTYVRAGEGAYSPIIQTGEADFIVSFEKMEGARYVDCLKKGGRIVTSSQMIDPMPVITGACVYPENVLEELKAQGVLIDEADVLSLALEAGSVKCANVVLIGRLSKYFDYPMEKWFTALSEVVKPQFLEMNKKAFELGRKS